MKSHPISINGNTGRISLPARFDVMSTLNLRIPFGRLLTDANTRKLVVDLSNLSYIDSMGIGTLIAWRQACGENGKDLVLEKCSSHVTGMLKLAGVERLFAFAPGAGS